MRTAASTQGQVGLEFPFRKGRVALVLLDVFIHLAYPCVSISSVFGLRLLSSLLSVRWPYFSSLFGLDVAHVPGGVTVFLTASEIAHLVV